MSEMNRAQLENRIEDLEDVLRATELARKRASDAHKIKVIEARERKGALDLIAGIVSVVKQFLESSKDIQAIATQGLLTAIAKLEAREYRDFHE